MDGDIFRQETRAYLLWQVSLCGLGQVCGIKLNMGVLLHGKERNDG